MPDGDARVTRRHVLQATTFIGATTVLGAPVGGRTQAGTDAWPQPRFDAGQTGFNPSATGPDPDTVDEHWTYDGVSTPVTPVVSTDRVFLPAGESIRAVDRATAAEDWWTVVGEGITPLVVTGNTVCAIDLDGGSVTAVDATDGTVRWTRRPGARPGTRPVVEGGQVYFGDTDGLRVLDVIDGSHRWRVDLDGAVTKPVAVADGAVYVATGTALSRYSTDGTHEWDRDVMLADPDPVVADGRIYAGAVEELAGSPSLVALGTDDGAERWRVDRYADLGQVAAADWRLYVTGSIETADGIFAHDTEDGSEDWRVLLDTPVATPPVVGTNHVYVSLQDGRVLALHREHGGQEWEWNGGRSGPVGQPVVVDESVYVSSSDSGLVALRGQPSDGTASSADEMAEEAEPDDDSTPDRAGADTDDSSDTDGSDGFGPGFDILGTLAGLGIASSLYVRRSDSRQ